MADPVPPPEPSREAKLTQIKGTSAPPPTRYALGLPAGSVRAVLAFMVLGLIWALMFLHKEVPLYLQYLMFMILGHYFAARRHAALPSDLGEPMPLYLPRGVLRAFIFLGFAGVFASLLYQHRDNLEELAGQLRDDRFRNRFLPLLLVAAFFLGLVAAKVGRLFEHKAAVKGRIEDIQAWLSLVAVFLLAGEVIIQLIINPSLAEDRQIHLPHLENILAAIVGFYFGARS